MKTITYIFIFFLSAIHYGFAQEIDNTVSEDKIYTYVGEWPEFPGGNSERNKFLSSNLTYPISAASQAIQGRVIVGFTVQKDGNISNVKILKGAYPALDEEALRVVSMMPRWKPGKNDGVPVNTRHKIDVVFSLPPGAFLQTLSCDSTMFSAGSPPIYKSGAQFEFNKEAKAILNYINPSLLENKKGTVTITFTITKDNELFDINVLQATDAVQEEEALNVIRKLRGNWKAGLRKGKPVDVKYKAVFLFQF